MKVNLVADKAMAEIYQNVQMQFAFAKMEGTADSAVVTQLHPFVLCRDFLSDAMYATKTNSSCSIYSFCFDAAKAQVDFSKMGMLIAYADKAALEKHLTLLHYHEKKAHLKRTVLHNLNIERNGKHIYLAVGSKCWMKSPALVSLYTLLWRLAGVGKKDTESMEDFLQRAAKCETNDGRYLRQMSTGAKKLGLKDAIETLLVHRNKVFDGKYKEGESIGSVHNYSGIVSLYNFANSGSGTLPLHVQTSVEKLKKLKEISACSQ